MLTYEDRMAHLRERKEAQTLEKLRRNNNYMNEDDYGSVPPPENFHVDIEFNDEVNHTFYGAELWARNFRKLLEAHPVYIDPEDALAGRWMFILQRLRPFESVVSNKNLEMAPAFDYGYLKPTQEKYGIVPGIGKMHHFAPDYELGLKLGWGGVRKKVAECRALHPESAWLYDAEDEVLRGARNWMSRTIDKICELEETETDPTLRENLRQMELVNRNILDGAPSTFREACQWMAWFNMLNRTYNRAGAGTQLDEVLRPFYERDRAAGILTDDDAKFIIACLFINDPVYYQIGGPAPDGRDLTSPLSFLILEAAHMAKTSVNLTIRVHDRLDPRLLRRGVEILLEDRKACPRFSGDKSLVEGFMKNGYSHELACRRIAVGCHWMSLPGMEYTLNDLIKINFAKVMEVALDEYMAGTTGDCAKDNVAADGSRSTEELYGAFLRHLAVARDCVAEGIDFHLANQYKNAPELMLNLFSHGPLEKGLDASNGGMDYYNICVDGAAIATVADSFAAMEQRIEIEKRLTWGECIEALHSDFKCEGGERIKLMLNASDRFGRGGSLGDKWAKRISHDFTELISGTRTPNGVLMIPGLFSWANTISLGEEVGATANGRGAGEPISQGANPHPGFREDGALTAQSNAVASVQCGRGNTAPLQLELSPSAVNGRNAVDVVEAMLRAHFAMGGTLVNINVMDKKILLDAYKNPEKYPDLIVRVTGFTAYFITLSPGFRKMIVERVISDD